MRERNIKKINLKLWPLFFLFLIRCNYMELNGQVADTSADLPVEAGCLPSNNVVTQDQITFSKIKSEVIDPHCLRCHNPSRPSAGIDLSNYSSVKSRLTQFDFAISRNIMPPSGALDPTLKGLVADWIKAGAINQAVAVCSEGTEPSINTPTDPQNPTIPNEPSLPVTMPSDSELNFAFIKANILDLRCISCHSDAGGNRGELNLERYSNVVDELKDIIEEVNQETMPPSPRQPLSVLEKNIISRWARLGAPR